MQNANNGPRAGIIGIRRHCLLTDGEGITTLVGFSGCPLRCEYCINKICWKDNTPIKHTPKSLYDEVKKDLLYMIATGGGIMFGGGEPGLQSGFIETFRNICDERLHIYIETSLNFHIDNLIKLLPIVDAWLVDIKDMNPDIYQKYTHRSNEYVLSNLLHISQNGYADKTTIRIPHIAGYNTEDDIHNSIEQLKAMGFSKFDIFTYRTNELKKSANIDNAQNNRMNYGKAVCEVLKQVRVEIANANNLTYSPHYCPHKQCAKGTCPVCEKELIEIEQLLIEKETNNKPIIL